MFVYFYLLFFTLILGILTNCVDEKKRKIISTIYCVSIFTFIYILVASRAISVGNDTKTYSDIYLSIAGDKKLFDVSYSYMEKGYIFLMNLSIKLGFSFRIFLFICCFISLAPICLLIIKCSKNKMISIIVFICYQFFVFEMSAIRQSMAIGICVLAYLILKSNKKLSLPFFIILVLCSALIHKASIIFLIVPLILKVPVNALTISIYLILSFILIAFNKDIYSFIATHLSSYYVKNATMELGGSFYFLCLLLVFACLTYLARSSSNLINSDYFKMLSIAIMLYFVISGSNLLRAAMYFTIFLTILIPEIIENYSVKSQLIINICFTAFFVTLFLHDTLIPNQLNIVPYIPFWKEYNTKLMVVLLNA